MKLILNIVTQPLAPWQQQLLPSLDTPPDTELETVDLTQPEPDYPALVDKIFQASQIFTW